MRIERKFFKGFINMTTNEEKRRQCNLTNSEETAEIVKEYCLPPKNLYPPERVAIRSNIPVWWECEAGHFFRKSPQARTLESFGSTGCPICREANKQARGKPIRSKKKKPIRDDYTRS